jgi:hypothetical protein
MLFTDYEKWLHEQYAKIVLGPQAVKAGSYVEAGPYCDPTILPNEPPWKMEWAVIFADGMSLRVTENWFKRKPMARGFGFRQHFSFHYGPANPTCDPHGIPIRSDAYPAIIRVDCDRHGPHLHYQGDDHIPQSRVKKFRISDAEPFAFVRAVLEHRATGSEFHKILKFEVIP